MYELIVIGKADDEELIFSKIEKLVADSQATAVSTQKLGKKNLAYPIRKQTEGNYFLFNFEAPGEAIGAISGNLKLEQESVLRYLITRVKEKKGAAGKVVRAGQEKKVLEEKEATEKPQARMKKTVKVAVGSVKVKGKASKK